MGLVRRTQAMVKAFGGENFGRTNIIVEILGGTSKKFEDSVDLLLKEEFELYSLRSAENFDRSLTSTTKCPY